MKVFLSHDSARSYWAASRRLGDLRPAIKRVVFAPELPCGAQDAQDLADELAWYGVGRPVHLLVDRGSRNRCAPSFRLHSTVRVPPSRAFYEVKHGWYVSIPEFCFLQLAQAESLVAHIRFGYELCGYYTRDYSNRADDGADTAYQVPPLSSPGRLRRFAEANRVWDGSVKALRACDYIIGGAASPAETAISMLLSLPNRMGGYALPRPHLNSMVRVTDARTGFSVPRYCDLYWPQYGLAIEYDSDEFHASRAKLNADASRRIDLALQSVEVITVTRDQLYRTSSFDNVARLVAKKMGVVCRSRVFDLSDARIKLRDELLSS